MKQVISGAGADTSSAALTYMSTTNELRLADLYMLGDEGDPNGQLFTNWEAPLLWGPYGTFKSTVVSRNTVSSKIGLEVATLEVKWSPKVAAFGTTTATMNFYQRAQLGFYRNYKLRVWRAVMPTAGDLNTYGAYQLFGGRVATSEVTRALIKFTLNSFLDVINLSVPPNTIENTNILAGFQGATPVLVDSETVYPRFTVVAPSSTTNILGDCTAPTATKIYGTNKLQFGYLYFLTGANAGAFSVVASNASVAGPHNQFIVYGAFPFGPTAGDTFFVSSQFPIDQAAATAAGIYRGFPFVPSPEQAA